MANDHNDEYRAALHATPELERVDTGRVSGGFLIIGDRTDAHD